VPSRRPPVIRWLRRRERKIEGKIGHGRVVRGPRLRWETQAALRGALAARFSSIYKAGPGYVRGRRLVLTLDAAETHGALHAVDTPEARGF